MTAPVLPPTQFTINNIDIAADTMPLQIVDEVQAIIDNPRLPRPDEIPSAENFAKCGMRMSYFKSAAGFLLGLWGAMRVATHRTDATRVAVRDYLEKAHAECKFGYEEASRQITAYEKIIEQEGSRGASS